MSFMESACLRREFKKPNSNKVSLRRYWECVKVLPMWILILLHPIYCHKCWL